MNIKNKNEFIQKHLKICFVCLFLLGPTFETFVLILNLLDYLKKMNKYLAYQDNGIYSGDNSQ